MKHIFAICLFMVGLGTSFAVAQTDVAGPPMDGPVIEFETETLDFGNLPHKGDASGSFVVWNRGTADLVINMCKGSCGCTVPTCPTTAIKAGESAKIPVKYDSNRIGYYTKNVTVMSNAINAPSKTLTIKGNIEAPPASETPAVNPATIPPAPSPAPAPSSAPAGHEGHGHN